MILTNKIALVTGANSGIGRAIAARFAAEGAKVYVTGRREVELAAAAKEIGDRAIAIRGDVSNLADLDRIFAQIRTEEGRLDILAANAGGGELARLGEISEEHFDKTFDTNVKGTLFTVQKALPLMQSGGSIIITGSTSSEVGNENFSVYGATKAALRNLVRSWILDLKGTGIRVNILSPGPTETPGLKGLVPTDAQSGFLDTLAVDVPLGRVGEPREIANAALFLASDEASFVHGTEMFVDGGQAQV